MFEVVLPIGNGFAFWPFYFMPKWVIGTEWEEPVRCREIVYCSRQAWWTPVWWTLYILSKSFRWREEQHGYSAEISMVRGRERPTYYAHILAENYGGMVNYAAAMRWARKEFAKRSADGIRALQVPRRFSVRYCEDDGFNYRASQRSRAFT